MLFFRVLFLRRGYFSRTVETGLRLFLDEVTVRSIYETTVIIRSPNFFLEPEIQISSYRETISRFYNQVFRNVAHNNILKEITMKKTLEKKESYRIFHIDHLVQYELVKEEKEEIRKIIWVIPVQFLTFPHFPLVEKENGFFPRVSTRCGIPSNATLEAESKAPSPFFHVRMIALELKGRASVKTWPIKLTFYSPYPVVWRWIAFDTRGEPSKPIIPA